MRKIVVVVSTALAVAIGACGNDPRIIDAGVGSATACKMTSAYLQDCQGTTNDPACMGCNCVAFGHEFYCTPTCTTVADCPAPAVACTNNYCMK
jgi:hypothetical protein